jgi:hypothetical protein
MKSIRVTQGFVAIGLGALFLTLGALAVFLADNAPGGALLLAVGVLALGVAAFSDRIGSLSFGGAKLELRDMARQRFALAEERESRGDAAGASVVRRQAHGFQRLAGAYERLRRTKPPGPERTRVLDDIVGEAKQLAQDTHFDPIDVWAWFDEGADEARVIALGLMLGDPRLCDFYCAMDAIENSRSAFEQYYGLAAARKMIADLKPLERKWLKEAVVEASKARKLGPDRARGRVGEAILAELDRR